MRTRTTERCRMIVAPMVICGAWPADPIHDAERIGCAMSNGHRRHRYGGPPLASPDQLANALDPSPVSGYSVNGDTPWHVIPRKYVTP